MAREARILGGRVCELKGEALLDGLVAGETERLGFLAQQVLAATVVGRMAGEALLARAKLMGLSFPGLRTESFVADLAEAATAIAMENV